MNYSNFRFQMVVDWIEVEFHTLTPSQGFHVYTGSRFSFVHGCDPVTGELLKQSNTTTTLFVGRIQNPKSYSDLLAAIKSHPKIDQSKTISIVKIEVAFDAYARKGADADIDSLAVHMYRNLARPASLANQALIGKTGKSAYRQQMPKQRDNNKLAEMLRDGWSIGIGHKDEDAHYQRLYSKRSDDGNSQDKRRKLPVSEHRARFENQFICREHGEIFGNATLSSFEHFQFNALSGYFKFKTVKDGLSDAEQQRNEAKPWQVASMYKQRRSKGGGERLFPRNSRAINELNKRASRHLQALSKRWHE